MENKKYLDLAGLARYDEKIKNHIKTHGSDITDDLVELIGAAKKGEGEETVIARVSDLERNVASNGEYVENAINGLWNAINDEETARRYTDSRVKDLETEIGVASAPASGEEEAVAATGLHKRIEDLEDYNEAHPLNYYSEDATNKIARIYAGGTAELKIDGKAENSIAAKAEGPAMSNLLQIDASGLGYKSLSNTAKDTYTVTATLPIGSQTQVVDNGETKTTFFLNSYGTTLKTPKFTYNGKEIATIDQVGSAEDKVEDLEALHAKKEDNSFKTVAEEINEAIAALIDGAPDALDTLKEIADWISEQGETDEEGVAQLVSKIEKNASAIAKVEKSVEDFERVEESDIDALFGEIAEETENA